jgi:diguanylate cyclase (GGDEF)-like protein
VKIRLDAMLRRSDRDLYVHPSTRLPGAIEIEAEIGRRLALDLHFATCYADLDHFKEFNDRYSYYEGDRVIRILAQILHDVVKGVCHEDGFVGHIGGDDFIFIIPMEAINETCEEIVNIFDLLIPYQYSEQDRRAGYFFGKDRRGQLHRVPLMTVSIGVVTNERRRFTHAAQVSALATEMKSYAKTLPGSVFSIDRRTDSRPVDMPAVSSSHASANTQEEK